MSLSTTTTALYELTKYSRAYSQSTNGSVQTELEWQHFANPVIRLTLDMKKSSEGRLESLRLRIIWKFSAGADAMDVDQNEVVFEDLDLVAYSVMPTFQAPQGVPLKAVYQGAVVGLRYQHPRVAPPGQAPQYRRFQVTFHDDAAANAFVERIRFVCPCKANAGPPAPRGPRPTQTQVRPQPPTPSRASTHIAMPESRAPPASLRQVASMMTDEPAPLPTVQRMDTTLPQSHSATRNWLDTVCGSQPPMGQGSDICTSLLSSTTTFEHDSSRPSSAITVSSAVADHPSSEPAALPTGAAFVPTPPEQVHKPVPQSSGVFRSPLLPPGKDRTTNGTSSDAEASLPSSSLPSSSSLPPPASRPLPPSSPVLMPPPPVPPLASLPRASQKSQADTPASSAPPRTADSRMPGTDTPDASASSTSTLTSGIEATLRDAAGLYELSKDQLESLVAEVIRDEGFAELMRSLDGMWKIKGLAGIAA
ncbi:hypothetical protein OH76DRAFT_179808 [Lentinus brumalis]|uniref:Uncharacterized protein n=1 Tax=Lentinus brumalis TaxID=2498619 RepID=A0A371CNB8_9APHY|nr:hypothetical protein OH76DRAFT_179808 [Polyporus brumalis]